MVDIPPPPENPFDSGNNGMEPPIDMGGDSLPQSAPDVAARNGKAFLVLGILVLVVVLLLYFIFFGGKKSDSEVKPPKITVSPTKYEPPQLPQPPTSAITPVVPLAAPTIPAAVSLPDITSINPLTPKEDAAAKAQQMARIHSGMFIKDGSGGLADALSGSNSAKTTPTDPNAAFAAQLSTTVERTKAGTIGNLNRTIAQGRIIQATMESAMRTDLPAPIRAIVSRDCYAEGGRVVLIPKGSRLIGTYNTAIGAGQTRVFVVWTRVIRPDGIDVTLSDPLATSPLVDQIGQAGVGGQVDSKFQEMFARSLLASVMNIAVGIASDKIEGGTTTTTNSAEGGSQTSGDAATTATTNALNRLGSTSDSFLQRFLNVAPTILVDQGTVVNVFVNKDIVFPEDITGAHILN